MTINGRPIEAMGASARAARLVVDDLDALKSTKTQFDPYQVRYPPDGYLDRAEFSSRHFESIDQRGDKDGRVSRAELEMALAIAKPGVAERVEQAALAARGDLLAEVDAARGALVPFAVGAGSGRSDSRRHPGALLGCLRDHGGRRRNGLRIRCCNRVRPDPPGVGRNGGCDPRTGCRIGGIRL